ncbi:hypothetical protein HAX54_033236 [Datura stramonium]|uniref:Uncharacterized protein n=1 Tax=Datura stramonium TaxID=4076 RepID=A0ABS8SD68_DATST|nr:hypothetical protein [Datura stramonium]
MAAMASTPLSQRANRSDKEAEETQTKLLNKFKINGLLNPLIEGEIPWQERNSVSVEEIEDREVQFSEVETEENPLVNESVSSGSSVIISSWVHGNHPKSQLDESSTVDLEHRTGGLVIWRSGSSIVSYTEEYHKLPCVQSFTSKTMILMNRSIQRMIAVKALESNVNEVAERPRNGFTSLSGEEIVDLSKLNMMLDEVGPHLKMVRSVEPLPVDADLLPAVVPGYRPPFRRLPYGVKLNLKNTEMTYLRRTARIMPPHFALEGTENCKVLTGGTLLSRNKDYIVFYRGNDFLPSIKKNKHGKEQQRLHSFPDTKAPKRPLVAGTLSETMAATSRWGNQPSIEEREKMMREAAVARHASDENREPSELPTDLEILSAEERKFFRKMGLSMRPFCFLRIYIYIGNTGLVKITVSREETAQIKHIAITLEAEWPKNLLTKRQALARSIELQRREALKHHITELQDKIQNLKSELEDTNMVEEIEEETLYSRLDASDDEDDMEKLQQFEGESKLNLRRHGTRVEQRRGEYSR